MCGLHFGFVREEEKAQKERTVSTSKMKVRSAVRKMCKECYLVKRKGKLFCYCKNNPRHKQRQGFHSFISHPNTTGISTLNQNQFQNNNPFASQTSFMTNINAPPLLPAVNSTSGSKMMINSFAPLRFGFGAASFFI